jgi:hypothetical protein
MARERIEAEASVEEVEIVEAPAEEVGVFESPATSVVPAPEEVDPDYRDPNLVYVIYKGLANAFATEDDTLLRRGVPTGLQPEVAERLVFHYRKTQEIVKE